MHETTPPGQLGMAWNGMGSKDIYPIYWYINMFQDTTQILCGHNTDW